MNYKAIILTLCCTAAQAEFRDGNQMLSDMTGDINDRMYSLGYIAGVADTGRSIIHCMPANATLGQVRDMVKNYLDNTPAECHLTADILISRVLKIVWPCAKKGNTL